jgi:CBS domain-containing protein
MTAEVRFGSAGLRHGRIATDDLRLHLEANSRSQPPCCWVRSPDGWRPTGLLNRGEMTYARDVMHEGAEYIDQNETLADAARKMRNLHIGALPICGNDDQLHGVITDRDIVVRCVAEGRDPQAVTAGQLAMGPPICVEADADTDEALRLMEPHAIRRLPVLDENHRLVGMISEADLATHLGKREMSQFAAAVYSAPPTS